MSEPVFTVGHSTRTIPEFVDLLRGEQVAMVIDVRSIPKSRRNPDYNLDDLPVTLADHQIGHVHIPELGGRRGRVREVPPEVNAYWTNRSFQYYADHALTPGFAAGLANLLAFSSERRCAIMCAEAVWWRCHRRIVADYLLLHGREVRHIMAPGRSDPARMTPGAVPQGDRITYPPEEAGRP